MRAPSWESSAGALAAFLNSATQGYLADLYTITLSGGQVLRYTNADQAVTVNGNTFTCGPVMRRGKTKLSVGINVDSLDVTLSPGSSGLDAVNGVPLLQFVARGGLDGAQLLLQRAYAAGPPSFESAFNLLNYSEELDNAAWAKSNASITANAATTPGGKGADKLVENTATSTHYVSQATTFSFAAGDTIVLTALVKAAERNALQFRLFAGGAVVTTCLMTVDLLTGTIPSQQGGAMRTSVTAEGDGWYRLELEVLAGQAGAANAAVLLALGAGGGYSNTYLGDGTSGLHISEAQVRKGTHNLVLSPQGCSGAGWALNSCFAITPNTIAGPSGAVTADLLVRNAAATGNWADLTYNGTVGAGKNVGRSYKGSMWLWVPSGTANMHIRISDANYNTMVGPTITLTTTPQLFEFTTSGPENGWNPLGQFMGIGLHGIANTTSFYVGDVRLAPTDVYFPYQKTPFPLTPWIGTLPIFQGRVGVPHASRYEARLQVNSDAELLNVMIPRNIYQPGCSNTLFDAACGVSKAANAVAATASSASDALRTTFNTALGQAAGFFDMGFIVGVTGPNAGVARTVKVFASGVVTTIQPWPLAVAAGNTFTLYPGCDKSQATCSGKFANLLRFRGQPYVPAPETIL